MAREVLIRSDLPPVQGPSSHGVKAGDWAFTAGMLPLAADSSIVGTSPGVADVEAQSARCVQSMSSVLEALDVSLAQVTKVKSYMSDLRHRERYESAYAEAMSEPYPAHACVERPAIAGNATERHGLAHTMLDLVHLGSFTMHHVPVPRGPGS